MSSNELVAKHNLFIVKCIQVVFQFELRKLNVFSIYILSVHCYINNNCAFGSLIQFLVDLYNIIQLT